MSEQELAVKLDALLAEYADACTAYGRASSARAAGSLNNTAMESAAAHAELIREKIVALVPPGK